MGERIVFSTDDSLLCGAIREGFLEEGIRRRNKSRKSTGQQELAHVVCTPY